MMLLSNVLHLILLLLVAAQRVTVLHTNSNSLLILLSLVQAMLIGSLKSLMVL